MSLIARRVLVSALVLGAAGWPGAVFAARQAAPASPQRFAQPAPPGQAAQPAPSGQPAPTASVAQTSRPPAPPSTAGRPARAEAVDDEVVSTAPRTAEQTRRGLDKVLSRYSPNLGRIIALDPLLLQNPAYLEPYPELAAFLGQHPEVVRNAAFYFSNYRSDYFGPLDPEERANRNWGNFLGGAAMLIVFVVITSALMWLVKTLIDYRRWYRLSKVQTEAHNKLLDRLGANEELMAYIGSPAGKRFLEAGPIMVEEGVSAAGPLRRILWSIQVGVVVVCGGIGIMIAKSALPEEFNRMLSVVGVFAIAVGVGFVLAAGASALISKRLGVIDGANARDGRVANDQPTA